MSLGVLQGGQVRDRGWEGWMCVSDAFDDVRRGSCSLRGSRRKKRCLPVVSEFASS